jgi:hypothetical protein
MDFRSFINSILRVFYYTYAYLLKVYVFFVPLPIQIPVPTIIDFTNQYIEKNKKKFLDTFNIDYPMANINIENEFYDKKAHKIVCLDSGNSLENNWRRRVLFETTPRGNIIMFYDAFKMGFSYYSDVNNLPYNLLNAVAMKYALMFCCRDFFMDDNILPKDKLSPLIKIYAEEPEKIDKIKKKVNRTNTNAKNPFAKLKDYKKIENKSDEPDKKEVEIDNVTNRFLCLGKTVNFKFIQSLPKDAFKLNGFKSNLLDHLSGETTLQNQVMNYKDFKNLRNRKVPTA